MELHGVTDSMVERALREERLVKDVKVPHAAVLSVCRAMHETQCAHWDHSMDEQKAWDELPEGAKQGALREAAWMIGRLALDGFVVVSRENLRKIGA